MTLFQACKIPLALTYAGPQGFIVRYSACKLFMVKFVSLYNEPQQFFPEGACLANPMKRLEKPLCVSIKTLIDFLKPAVSFLGNCRNELCRQLAFAYIFG